MTRDLLFRDGIRLILITGSPGTSKSTVGTILYGAQTSEWRLLSLDDFFYLKTGEPPAQGDAWDWFEANAQVRAAVIKYIGDRRGRVIAEGIIQSDREVQT